MSEWKQYQRTGFAEMRPYVPGESLEGVSVSEADFLASPTIQEHDDNGPLILGPGMIARNPQNHEDQWFVAQDYFEDNFVPHTLPEPQE